MGRRRGDHRDRARGNRRGVIGFVTAGRRASDSQRPAFSSLWRALPALLLLLPGRVMAAPPAPAPPPVTTIHPIFAASDAPLTDVIHKQFSGAVARRGL